MDALLLIADHDINVTNKYLGPHECCSIIIYLFWQWKIQPASTGWMPVIKINMSTRPQTGSDQNNQSMNKHI